ncbi:hypothetical protein D9758_000955 [Tetrapyrgos nigripes]|uniref:DUF7598 domain-containing protein n=1 Tax=Tetrapyrgos nigripes TaxID=182062 RepID=A0A8H5LY65_9AGAR|nr:hypothetical protein D9758_000955 [Tetrapyrgos nigripes]
MTSRSYIFIGLNAVRALSIIGLILVFSSSILVMVTNIKAVNAFQAAVQNGTGDNLLGNCDYIDGSTVPNQAAGVFWAVVSTLLILFQSVILLLSECSWPMPFFDRFFPVLGTNFGLGALGIFQGLIGAQILSHHVDDFTLVAGFFVFSIGCLNMLLGLIFRESAKQRRSLRAWRDQGKEILPTANATDKGAVFVNVSPAFVSRSLSGTTYNSEKAAPVLEFGHWNKRASADSTDGPVKPYPGYGFGRQGEKKAGLRGFILQKPEESLPRYATPPPPPAMPTPVSIPAPHPDSEVSSQYTSTKVSLHRKKSTRTSTSSFQSPGSPAYSESMYNAYPHHPQSNRQTRDDDDLYESEDDDDERFHEVPRIPYGGPPAFKSSQSAL